MQASYLAQKVINTFKRNGIKAVYIKSIRRAKSEWSRLFINDKVNSKKWEGLKNKYAGKRVFLIGNGPSLNRTPLYLLKNEYTMGFNRFSLFLERLNWNPTFYSITDNLVLNDMLPELDEIIQEIQYCFFPDIHFRGDKFISKIPAHEKIYWLRQIFGKGFSTRLPRIYQGGSVIYEGFQILNFLGFKEIYFIGVDMNFKIHDTAKSLDSKSVDIISNNDDDPNHLTRDILGKTGNITNPKLL